MILDRGAARFTVAPMKRHLLVALLPILCALFAGSSQVPAKRTKLWEITFYPPGRETQFWLTREEPIVSNGFIRFVTKEKGTLMLSGAVVVVEVVE